MPARTHGGSKTQLYLIWNTMLNRCRNPKVKEFKNYGARGIDVCPRWWKFENFKVDMGDRPFGTTLERADNQGNYDPRNCYWATRASQARNKRNNRVITYKGRSQILQDWANDLGINAAALHHRLASGWSIEKALTTPKPKRPNSKLTMRQARAIRSLYPGLSMDKIAAKYGVSKKTVLNIVHDRILVE
jgi:hypothetical protein